MALRACRSRAFFADRGAPMGSDATEGQATCTLAVFFCINLLNYSDRQAVSAVLPMLLDGKTNGLGADVSSTQGGMLTTAFIVVYMCVSPVFGYLADRVPSRKLLVVVGLTLWAVASGLSSFAPSYATLLAASPDKHFPLPQPSPHTQMTIVPLPQPSHRTGMASVPLPQPSPHTQMTSRCGAQARAAVGVGEASYNTVAPVIISDMYPPAERTAKLAVFYIAIPLGSAMGFMIGTHTHTHTHTHARAQRERERERERLSRTFSLPTHLLI